MRRALFVLCLSLVGSSCNVKVSPDDGFYQCRGPDDCTSGYTCQKSDEGATVSYCVKPCSGGNSCDNGGSCVNGYCFPDPNNIVVSCESNFDCPSSATYCEPTSKVCLDPCANLTTCGPYQGCRRDPNFEGGRECTNDCGDSSIVCGTAQLCTNSNGVQQCRPTCFSDNDCPTSLEACADLNASQNVCVACDGTCTGDCSRMNNQPGKVYCEMPGENNCFDGSDNDADGARDCEDVECGGAPGCASSGGETCGDGDDSDSDGLCDCFDSDCRSDSRCSGWFALQPTSTTDTTPQPFVTNMVGGFVNSHAVGVSFGTVPYVAWTDENGAHVVYNPNGCGFVPVASGSDDRIDTAPTAVGISLGLGTDATDSRVHLSYAKLVELTSGSGEYYNRPFVKVINGGTVGDVGVQGNEGVGDSNLGPQDPFATLTTSYGLFVAAINSTQVASFRYDGSNWAGQSLSSGGPPALTRLPDGRPLLLWPDTGDVLYTDWDASGTTWAATQSQTIGDTNYNVARVAASTYDNDVFVAASLDGVSRALRTYKITTSSGLTAWPANAQNTIDDGNLDIDVGIAATMSKTYMTYSKRVDTHYEIFVSTMTNDEHNANNVTPTTDNDDSYMPHIAAGGGLICVSWLQGADLGLVCHYE